MSSRLQPLSQSDHRMVGSFSGVSVLCALSRRRWFEKTDAQHLSFPLFLSSNPSALGRQFVFMLCADPVFQEFHERGVAERGMATPPVVERLDVSNRSAAEASFLGGTPLTSLL